MRKRDEYGACIRLPRPTSRCPRQRRRAALQFIKGRDPISLVDFARRVAPPHGDARDGAPQTAKVLRSLVDDAIQ